MGSKPSDNQSLVPKTAFVVDLEAYTGLKLALKSKDFEIGKTD